MEPLIVPAIIAKSQGELDMMLDRVRGRAKRIMLDVMDGEFVENVSLDFNFRLPRGFEYEAHLMVENPLDWVEAHGDKADMAILHVETLEDVRAAVDSVREGGLEVSLALNPETELNAVLPHLDEVDGVLIMTVKPGEYGAEFLPEALDKVRRLRGIDGAIPIEVDGGMNPGNARLARSAGATIFASGSYIFKSDDVDRAIRELREAVR